MNSKKSRHDFIMECVKLTPNIKFQYYYKGFNGSSWNTYQECLKKHSNLFMVNNKMLRTSIETETLSEFRIDLDTKDENDNKSLKLAVIEALNIMDILESHNIKASLYYSGGKGIHIHFLFTSLKMPELEFRKKFKLSIAKQLSILNIIDIAPLSPNTTFGCEGYEHRKTENTKIFIDYKKYNTLGTILKFIDNNLNKIILNTNYFNEISDLTSFKTISPIQNPLNHKKVPRNGSNLNPCTKTTNSVKVRSYLISFIELYKEKEITSKHFFPLMVTKFLLSENLDLKEIQEYLELFIIKSGCNFEKDINNFIIDTSKLNDNRVFIYCNPDKERFYFTFAEFCEKNNKYMKLLNQEVKKD